MGGDESNDDLEHASVREAAINQALRNSGGSDNLLPGEELTMLRDELAQMEAQEEEHQLSLDNEKKDPEKVPRLDIPPPTNGIERSQSQESQPVR